MLLPLHDENPIRRWPVVTVTIIAINVAVMLHTSRLSELDNRRFNAQFGFVPARITLLTDPGLVRRFDLVPEAGRREPRLIADQQRFLVFQPNPVAVLLSLVSCTFLHGGIMHLVGNLWFFWVFGNNIEDRLGHFVFLGFYLLGGMLASICHWAMIPEASARLPMIGASGAVAVMLGAYAVTYPKARVKCLVFLCVIFFFVDLPALVVLGVWIIGQVMSALGTLQLEIDGGVAWWAHVGGFLAGAVVMPLLTAVIAEPPDRLPPATRDFGISNDRDLHDPDLRWSDN